MVGLPYENKRLFLDTVSLCRELPIRSTNYINVFHPYPATELGDLCEEKGWLLPKKHYREREDSVTSYPGFDKEEIKLCKDAFPYLLTFRFLPLGLTTLTVCGLIHRLSNYLRTKSSLYSKALVRLKRVFLSWSGSRSYPQPRAQDEIIPPRPQTGSIHSTHCQRVNGRSFPDDRHAQPKDVPLRSGLDSF